MLMRYSILVLLLASSTLLSSCDNAGLLQDVRESGRLIVLTTNGPTTWFYDRDDKLSGPEYEMTTAFAEHLGVKIVYRDYESTHEVLEALAAGNGHMAAAGLTINDSRKKTFSFGPAYQTLDELLVCHRNHPRVRQQADLIGLDITVAASSSYVDTLSAIEGLDFDIDEDRNTQQPIEAVAKKKLGCTVSDSTRFHIERRYHTEIDAKYTLSESQKLAWMLPKQSGDLRSAIEEWFDEYEQNALSAMLDRYYGFVEIFDYVDTHTFLRRVESRLPKYRDWFIDAAEKNDIEPALLAAQSYQESHWNPKAKSPTGVRGIMMLTLPVAKSLGVRSRLDAKSNIYAGARFKARMIEMVDHVEEPDRTWLALAAYNVGRGHFRDAQSLAKKLGKNPYLWSDMKEVLPLLSQKDYYKNLRYGYARGNEPVTYVKRIRHYETLLYAHFEGIGS